MEVTKIPGQSFENQQRRARLYWEHSGELVALGQTSTRTLGLQQELQNFPTALIPSQPRETDIPSTHLGMRNSLSNPRILMCFIKNELVPQNLPWDKSALFPDGSTEKWGG